MKYRGTTTKPNDSFRIVCKIVNNIFLHGLFYLEMKYILNFKIIALYY